MKDKEHENAQAEESVQSESTDTSYDPELEDIEENVNAKLKSLRAKLQTSEEERSNALEELQRTKADFLNAKRRLEADKDESIERAIDNCLLSMMPLYDSFQMAMQDNDTWNTVSETWRKGMEGVYNQLEVVFSSYGATPTQPVGEPFNPSEHEAMKEEPVDDATKHDHVTSVIQAGLTRTRNDGSVKILRPARVIVGTFTQPNE